MQTFCNLNITSIRLYLTHFGLRFVDPDLRLSVTLTNDILITVTFDLLVMQHCTKFENCMTICSLIMLRFVPELRQIQ